MGLWHAPSVVHNDFGRMALGIYVVMARLKDGCAAPVDIGFQRVRGFKSRPVQTLYSFWKVPNGLKAFRMLIDRF
jgi:hypothetical protein